MNILNVIRTIFDSGAAMLFIFMAIVYLLVDGPKYKSNNSQVNSNNSNREYKIIKAISYSYIAIGIALLIILYIG